MFHKGRLIIENIFFQPFAFNNLNESILEPKSLCVMEIAVSGSNLQQGVPMEALGLLAAVGGWYHD